ncbi:MAG: DUF1016 domain-containing protein, partial [Alphaproteobacteria bacterium]|nr:DUF1016 domain-containing protein [Alphaproteobacteria bacterium]
MEITPQNYQKLLTEVQQTIKQSGENLVAVVNYEKVKISWQVGEKIEKHLKENTKPGERNNYGKKLLAKLTHDTGIKQNTLHQMHSFYQTYKTIPAPEAKLNWSHYRNLIAVKDNTKRQLLEDLATKENLGADRLQKKISQNNSEERQKHKRGPKPKSIKPLSRPTKGRLFTYSLNKAGEVDLGFNIFVSNKKLTTTKTRTDLHTYLATLER